MKGFGKTGLACCMGLLLGLGSAMAFPQAHAKAQDEAMTVSDAFNVAGADFANSHIYKHEGVYCSGDATHGLIPSAVWGDPVTVADNAYIMYHFTADEQKSFATMSLSFDVKIWNQSNGTAHNENAVYIEAGTNETALNEVQRFGVQGDNPVSLKQTLDEYAVGKSDFYVRIRLNLSKACGEQQSLAMLGVKLYTVSFVYTQQAGEAENNDYEKQVDFGAVGGMESAGAAEYEGIVAGGSSVHGALPAKTWSDPAEIADSSYVIYRLSAAELGEGRIFKKLSVDITARIWSQNSNEAYAENKINVYAGYRQHSTDILVKSYGSAEGDGTNQKNFGMLDLTQYAAGHETVFVKIQLVQSKTDCGQNKADHEHSVPSCGTVATADGYMNMDVFGVKLYKLAFSGATEEGTAAVVYDFERSSDFGTKGLLTDEVYAYEGVATGENGDATHGLCPASAWAGAVRIPESSYIVYRLQADNGYAFSDLEIAFSAKIWNQNSNECHAYNAVKVYAGANAVDFGAPVFTAKAGGADVNGYTVDLTQSAAGKRVLYVKIELKQYIQSCGKHNYADFASDADFVAAHHNGGCGSTATKDGYMDLYHLGVKLYSVNFRGIYQEAAETVTVTYNDGDETLHIDEEQEKGSALNGYMPETDIGYDFAGWYLDKECTQAVSAEYVANEDITLYAKWEKISYTISYHLNGGVNAEENPAQYMVEDLVVLSEPLREGFRFEGWYADEACTGEKLETVSGTGDVELYAKWTPNGGTDSSDSSSDGSSDISSDSSSESSSGSSDSSDSLSGADSGTEIKAAIGCGGVVGGGMLAVLCAGGSFCLALKGKKED